MSLCSNPRFRIQRIRSEGDGISWIFYPESGADRAEWGIRSAAMEASIAAREAFIGVIEADSAAMEASRMILLNHIVAREASKSILLNSSATMEPVI